LCSTSANASPDFAGDSSEGDQCFSLNPNTTFPDSDQRSQRSDAGELIVAEVIGVVKQTARPRAPLVPAPSVTTKNVRKLHAPSGRGWLRRILPYAWILRGS